MGSLNRQDYNDLWQMANALEGSSSAATRRAIAAEIKFMVEEVVGQLLPDGKPLQFRFTEWNTAEITAAFARARCKEPKAS